MDPAPEPLGNPPLSWRHPSRLMLAVWFAAVMLLTRAVNIGSDAFWYVQDIRGAVDRSIFDTPGLWDFAHLLWRPWGVLLAKGWMVSLAPSLAGGEQAAVTFLLLIANVAGALVSCFLVQGGIFRLTGRPWIATVVAASFLCFNPLLNDSRDGAPYVTAFALNFGALYLALFSTRERPVWMGVLTALSAACWVPMVVSFPAILVARPLLHGKTLRSAVRFMATSVAACAICGLVVFGVAAIAANATTVESFRAWMVDSSAGVNGVRDRTWLRMTTGMVRGIYNLGQDSVWFKWYLFKDPYARVGLGELFQASLARIGLFYAALLGLVVALWRLSQGRRILWLLAILATPHLALALRFESGSPERYLAPLGLLAIAFGYVVAAARGWQTVVLIALICAPIPANLMTAGANSIDAAIAHDAERIAPLVGSPLGSRVLVLGLRDNLFTLRYAAPFYPLHSESWPRIDTIQPFGTLGWRVALSCAMQDAWSRGGQVWVTRRVLRDEPLREWLWVNSDDPSINWVAVRDWARSLEQADIQGGEDGFFGVNDSPANRAFAQKEQGVETCPSP